MNISLDNNATILLGIIVVGYVIVRLLKFLYDNDF